jgi:hypothetical protein
LGEELAGADFEDVFIFGDEAVCFFEGEAELFRFFHHLRDVFRGAGALEGPEVGELSHARGELAVGGGG